MDFLEEHPIISLAIGLFVWLVVSNAMSPQCKGDWPGTATMGSGVDPVTKMPYPAGSPQQTAPYITTWGDYLNCLTKIPFMAG